MSDDGSSLCVKRYADVTEQDRILAHRGLMTPHMNATQTLDATLWFEDNESQDGDFCPGRCIGTRVVNDKCAFLDRLGRCSLQAAATAAGMHTWALKPLHCALYPLGIAGGVVSYDNMLQGEQECCSVGAAFDVPVFRSCNEELTHLLQEDGFRMLGQHYECLQRSRLPSVTCRQG